MFNNRNIQQKSLKYITYSKKANFQIIPIPIISYIVDNKRNRISFSFLFHSIRPEDNKKISMQKTSKY